MTERREIERGKRANYRIEARDSKQTKGGRGVEPGRLIAAGATKPRLSVCVGSLGGVAATEKAPLRVAATGVGPVGMAAVWCGVVWYGFNRSK